MRRCGLAGRTSCALVALVPLRRAAARRGAVLLLCALLLLGGLSACGAPSTGQAANPTATTPPSPTVTPTRTPNPPLSASAILDVRPASMSLIGHLDCTKGVTYSCPAAVIARASNSGSLRWTSSTTVPGQVTFSPASGVLAPGQQTVVTISIPLGDCMRGLFFFHGPANTHSIGWTC